MCSCLECGNQSPSPLCDKCFKETIKVLAAAFSVLHKKPKKLE